MVLGNNLEMTSSQNRYGDGTAGSIEDFDSRANLVSASTTPDTAVSTSLVQLPVSKRSAYVSMFILFFINLLNYMDRYTIAGVLTKIQDYFDDISDVETGLLQTVFICSYMIFAPIFGYLGDRYNRKACMIVGIFIWIITTLGGSFVGKQHFWLLILSRAFVGIGEASYSTIAPTILADLFVASERSAALAVFYIAIPVGSGLGYIVGNYMSIAMVPVVGADESWKWALRVTPTLGVLCIILIVLFVKEPQRGEAENSTHLVTTSYWEDLTSIVKIPSFMLTTLGFTAVCFVAGALGYWAPNLMDRACAVYNGHACVDQPVSSSLLFGIITVISGLSGVGLGYVSSKYFRDRNKRADPIICGFGLVACSPFLFFALVLAPIYPLPTWFLIAIGETFLCLNWSIVADIVLYTVVPTRRGTAEAFQILLSHTFGDAGSPTLTGVVSDLYGKNLPSGLSEDFNKLRAGLFMTPFVAALGGGCFLFASFWIIKDRERAEKIIKGLSPDSEDAAKEALEENGVDLPTCCGDVPHGNSFDIKC